MDVGIVISSVSKKDFIEETRQAVSGTSTDKK